MKYAKRCFDEKIDTDQFKRHKYYTVERADYTHVGVFNCCFSLWHYNDNGSGLLHRKGFI